MNNSHMTQKICWCIFLLTATILLPVGLSAQEQQPDASETGFYYTVQEGDTLWGIAQRFLGDPELWPDLWEKNSRLNNPHNQIYPGDVLRIDTRAGKGYAEKAVSVEAPPPARPEPPVEPPYFIYQAIEQVGFIRNPPVSPSGVIFRTQEDREMISYGDTVYIRLEAADTMPIGGLFTVYRTLETVKDPENRKNTLGTQHYLTGVVKITRQEEGYVLATVVRSYRTIEINDRVMPYETVTSKIYLDDNPAPVTGTILQSEEGTNLIGENAIAFIDKGDQDGVAVGQRYHVYNQDKVKLNSKGKKKAQQLPPEDIGSIIVLRAEQNTATVLVVDSTTEFASGAKFSAILK